MSQECFNKNNLIGKTPEHALSLLEGTKYCFLGLVTERTKYLAPKTNLENPTVYAVITNGLISEIVSTLNQENFQ